MNETDEALLKRLNAELSLLTERRNEVRRRITERKARFKEGDMVVYGKDVFRVSRVDLESNEPVYFGRKLKKDGTPGLNSRRFFEWRTESIRMATAEEVLARRALP